MSQNKNKILLLFDFSQPPSLAEWSTINDAVMGGLSKGGITWKDERCMVFSGTISFENSGGFSSIRTNGVGYDLSEYKGIAIKALGDGKIYKFTIRTDLSYDGISYQCQFSTTSQKRNEYFLPFDKFSPSYHGKKVNDHPPLNSSAIKRFGFIIADRQEGAFSLEIESISAVR